MHKVATDVLAKSRAGPIGETPTQQVSSFFARYPDLRVAALGHAANRPALNLSPFGVPVEFLDASREPGWVADYYAANAECFPGPLALPGWVLVDLYLLPGAICLLTEPSRAVNQPDKQIILAAYCCVPTVVAGTVMGVSLLSRREGLGAGFMAKRMALAMHSATRQRGITQWNNPALRVHSRFGPLQVLGPAPAQHGLASQSFVYEVDLGPTVPIDREPTWLPASEGPKLAAAAAAGEAIHLIAPGFQDGRLLVART